MTTMLLSEENQKLLKSYFEKTSKPELISTYLYFIEHAFNLSPVLFVRDKIVFQSIANAIEILEKEGKLWRETEIKIGYTTSSVDDLTKKIYICPFTGKVFGDNTHPNPQDAIYDWVSQCPENTERIGGLRVKRFFISEDPKVIQEYASKNKPKNPITKIVFSSAINGKLFHAKESVIEDFKANYLKPVTLAEVQNQSRFTIEDSFMEFIQRHLNDEKIASFVESLATIPEFEPYVVSWLGEVEEG